MRSTIAKQKTPHSGPGKSPTLVGSSSVLPKIIWSQMIYIWVTISFTTIRRTPIGLCLSVFAVWGWLKGSVIKWWCFSSLCVDAGNIYILPTKCTLFQIMHLNRAQNIIQCHYNSIWKHMCIKHLSYSTETYLQSNRQTKETGQKINMRSIS